MVIDGVAYETVEGDPAELSEPVDLPEPEGADLSPDPTALSVSESDSGAVTSPPPSAAAGVYASLSASVAEGVAPLEVNFTGELVGGLDDNRDFYCVESTFDFGDGISQSSSPGCVEWQAGLEIQRRFTANYLYEEPGEYQVVFRLGQTESEPVMIVVSGGSDEPTEPESVQTVSEQDELAGSDSSGNGVASPTCLLGLLPLPLLGLVVGRRRIYS